MFCRSTVLPQPKQGPLRQPDEVINGTPCRDGTAVGPSPRSQWAKHEIPAFVQSRGGAGAVVPMRTANSTFTAFADPLVWATWLPSPLSTTHAAVAELYEDAGDGTRASLLLAAKLKL